MNHECETCKHTELSGCDYPCHCCSVVYPNAGFSDMWERGGCDFCRDGKEKMPEDGEFNYCFAIEDNELWAWDACLDGGAAMKINYCPICGKKLVE